jgi:hypothetical protein
MGVCHDIYGFRSLFFPQSFQFSGAWWGWFWHCFNWFKKPTWERRITSFMAWLIQNDGNTWNQFHYGQMRLSLAWWLTCSREARDDSQICFMDGQFTYKAARTETTVFSWATLGNHILLIISYLIGGLEHVLFSLIAWDDDPIWRTPSFFRGVGQPPTSINFS